MGLCRGTTSSNPSPSSGESVSQRELARRGREAGRFARMRGPCQATESAETGMAGRRALLATNVSAGPNFSTARPGWSEADRGVLPVSAAE